MRTASEAAGLMLSVSLSLGEGWFGVEKDLETLLVMPSNLAFLQVVSHLQNLLSVYQS